jgi:putative FmdB family regulatory protein
MPMYSYTCSRCGLGFDARRSVEERSSAPCPFCTATAKKDAIQQIAGTSVDPGKPDYADAWTARPKTVF